MTIDSKTIAARKISAHFASIKNAIIIAPKTMNGERSKRRNTRLTPFWTAVSEIDHVNNAADDCRCFAAPCAGKHQHRTVYGENGFLLLFVQRTEVCLKCLSFQRNALLFCHVFLSLLSQYCLRCFASVWFYQGICPNVGHAFIIPYSAAFEKMHCKLFTIFRCRILFQENIMLIFSCFFA